jgi:hypothetical protein
MSCLKKPEQTNIIYGCMNGSSTVQKNHNQQHQCNSEADLIENFSTDIPKNMCHHTCSSINNTNILLALLFIALLYLIYKQFFVKK